MNLRDPEQLGSALSAYLDGELSPEETAQVERALKTSPDARRQLEALRNVVGQVNALPRTAAPPEVTAQLRDALAAPTHRTVRTLPLGYRWGLGLAAAIATIAVLTRFSGGPAGDVSAPLNQPMLESARVGETRSTPPPAAESLAPGFARAGDKELKRLQTLGYVSDESDADDLAAMYEAGVALDDDPYGADTRTAGKRDDARFADRSEAGELLREHAAAEPVATPVIDAATAIVAAPAYASGRRQDVAGTALRVRVNTSTAAQYERLQSWADGLQPAAPAVDGQIMLSAGDVAGVLDVLATEETADVDLELRFRAADIRELRAAFQEPTIAYVTPPPSFETEVPAEKADTWPPDVFAQRHARRGAPPEGRQKDQPAPAAPQPTARGRAAGIAAPEAIARPDPQLVLGQFGVDLITLRPMLVGPPAPRPAAPIAVDLQIMPPPGSTQPATGTDPPPAGSDP